MNDAAPALTVDALLAHLGTPDEPERAEAATCLDAAIAFVTRYHSDPDSWDAAVRLGCLMQAAGLFRRRHTPGGIEQFGETGIYTRAVDTEVERLLRIGRYAIPRVG